jgi:hypothetical protein
MNSYLDTALSKLSNTGARFLPSVDQVQVAPDGKSWEGKTKIGVWSLVKNHNDSYSCTC